MIAEDTSMWAKHKVHATNNERHLHVARVMHLRHENARGAQFVQSFMEKRCRFDLVEISKIDTRLNEADVVVGHSLARNVHAL